MAYFPMFIDIEKKKCLVAMRGKLQDFMKIIRDDPAVDNLRPFPAADQQTPAE